MTEYVAGFMFSMDEMEMRVALIRKNKPAWQAGKLNGIGGKIEPRETSVDAMVREFQEETGYATMALSWTHFLTMSGKNRNGEDFAVYFFHAKGDLLLLRSPEEEKIEIVHLSKVNPLRRDVIENLPWLIALAVDNARDGRPSFAKVFYEKWHGC